MPLPGLYQAIPDSFRQWLRRGDALLRPIPRRYGKVFSAYSALLKDSDWWPREKIEEYQRQELKKLLLYCQVNVPFYRDLWRALRFDPDRFSQLSDLEQLPLLDKETVRQNLDKLLSQSVTAKQRVYTTTGGTSGKPLGFYLERATEFRRLAFDWRSWNRMGYHFGDRCAVVRGNRVSKERLAKNQFCQYAPLENYLICSSFHLSPDNLPLYVQALRDFRPQVVRGYPSSLEILARYLSQEDISLPSVKIITTSSENLFLFQRQVIEEAFQAPVYDRFGNSEHTVLANQCKEGSAYHLEEEFGYSELADRDGKSIMEAEKTGEIVGTGFLNYAMPLIRYRTEDFATWSSSHCPCGRLGRTFTQIQGRWFQEQVVAKDGSLIAITALNSHSDIFDNVAQFQYYQEAKGELILRVVPKSGFSESDKRKILDELRNKIGSRMNLSVESIKEIPRTDRGKYRFLIQKLPLTVNRRSAP